MRIAQLVIGGAVAGGQLVALAIARAARGRGDEVVFLSPSRGPFTDLVEAEGMPIRDVDVSRTFRIGGAVRLARDLRRLQVDVLHTHGAIASNVLSRIAGRGARVPVVSHLHIENHLPRSRLRAGTLRALDNWSARLAARILVVSEDTKRALVEQGYPQERLEVVANGVHVGYSDNSGGRSLRAELGVPAAAPLVVEIARLCDVKGQRELIDAVAELDGVHAVLVGEDLEQGGLYRDLLERRIAERGAAGRIVLAGHRPDARAFLEEADVFALPSWMEGMPITVLEAMAHARPVVATAVGGTGEVVVDGVTGLLVPPRDAAALGRAIGSLLSDRDAARRIGEAGRRRVEEHFSEEAMTRRVLEVYDELAG
ncbi:MAG: glycosyltransferase [Gaiellaceae bacterium]